MSLGVLNKAACVTSLFFKIRQLDWTTCNWSSRRFSVNNLWVDLIHLIYYYNSVFNKIISLLSILFLSNMLPKVPFFFLFPLFLVDVCIMYVTWSIIVHLITQHIKEQRKTSENHWFTQKGVLNLWKIHEKKKWFAIRRSYSITTNTKTYKYIPKLQQTLRSKSDGVGGLSLP